MAEIPRRGPVLPLSTLFRLSSEFAPAGDQPCAIERLSELLAAGRPHSVLLGITGSGMESLPDTSRPLGFVGAGDYGKIDEALKALEARA